MKVVKGNKEFDISEEQYKKLINNYKNIILDIGTGDGRFIYKNALENIEEFYIGLDPSAKQLKNYSKKAVRKKLPNALFVIGSSHNIPKELENTINTLYVILPWGTLLQNLVLPSREFINSLSKLLIANGKTMFILSYSLEFEPSETNRLSLPELSEEHLKTHLMSTMEKERFKNIKIIGMEKGSLKSLESTWGKKLAYGNIRKIFKITAER